MFVIENTVSAIKSYMIERLTGFYTEREVNYFFKSAVCKRLNLNDTEFLLASNNRLSESDLLFFRNVVKRLQDREPFQYIIGNTWFYDLQFKCDKRALIPRPETEELVDLIIKENQNKSNLNLLDLCSGSGCIAIAIAKNLNKSRVLGIELSQEAIDLAKERGARVCGIVGRDGGYTAKAGDAVVIIPPMFPDRITPHTEGLCAVVWHLLVSHPLLQMKATMWESVSKR